MLQQQQQQEQETPIPAIRDLKPPMTFPSITTLSLPSQRPLSLCKEKHPLKAPPLSPLLKSSPPSTSPSSLSLHSLGNDQLLDHSHLKPGDNASLLSYVSTINMYRNNAKKTNDMEIQCDFAIFLVEAAKRLRDDSPVSNDNTNTNTNTNNNNNNNNDNDNDNDNETTANAYLTEAEKLLKQVVTRGHGPSQYYLANLYSSGLLIQSFDKAFPLYVQAAKHHHPDAAYRTAKCYEDGLGTRRDKSKAVQFYRKAATLNHPGAMYRLGLIEIKGECGRPINIRDGHKWLKRSAEAATTEYPHALHELAHLHERGLGGLIFQDPTYAVRLYLDASELGYAPSCFRLGECFEFGRLECPVDPSRSMHYYRLAADQDHPHACFALTAWYLIGIPGVMDPSDQHAFFWAKRAADHANLPRAHYAVGYFYEVGIGIEKDLGLAWVHYQKAAQYGEKRALQRIQAGNLSPSTQSDSSPSLTSSKLSGGWLKRWKLKLSRSKS